MTATVEELEAEVAWLKDRLAAATGADRALVFQNELGMPPKQARVLALLERKTGTVPREVMYAEVFEHANGDGPCDKTVDVHVSLVRRRLRALGAPEGVYCTYKCGHWISAPLRSWLGRVGS